MKEARACRDEARRLLANGVDPGIERKVQKAATVERAANSFEAVAREWFARHAPGWAKTRADKIIARLRRTCSLGWVAGQSRRLKPLKYWRYCTGSKLGARSIPPIESTKTAVRSFAIPWLPRCVGTTYLLSRYFCKARTVERSAIASPCRLAAHRGGCGWSDRNSYRQSL